MKLSILAATAALLSCAGSASAANIEFWYGNTGPVETAIRAQCDAFNAAQGEHKVTCIGQGNYEVLMQKAIAAYRAKTAPVLLQVLDAGTLDLMLSDAVVPVQDELPEVKWDSYIAGARTYYETSKGKLFAQPYNASTLLFYTNKTELEKAGVTKTPETWEEVVDAARKLKASGSTCPFVTNAEPWIVFEQFAARHGQPIASKHNGYDGLDAEYVFNKGLIAKHLTNLVDWRKEGLVRLNGDTKGGNLVASFSSGECAMIEASSGSYTTFTKAFEGKYELTVGLAPIYRGEARHNTLVGGASIYIMKGHSKDEIDGAKAFLNFVRQPEQQMSFSAATGYVPVTNDVLDAIAKSPDAKSPKYATAAIGIESMSAPATPDTRGIRLGSYIQFRQIWTEETQKAFAGQQTMQAALDNSKKRGDELLRRFQLTYKGVQLP
ncbi:sn-glycerol 3-phosphate transport system substrate-binding protein [Agrobacterium tumefaciens]|uniref:extracellular solute-binding protein n=1 Tax=Agrobacterium tumefaciens TaxID=358 RepID=UPI000DD0AA27|nr:extracellular solute-binding protein [Agrobacterium tumefaciens]MBP2509148.1 sn-glycerol 3-phosphate transport system substrate-binding protein [Agrobacterium tumefaciens]MBP2518301.1 sn-glycerol 3-phosphate transport system substrate-binding protein [Agrobacterium tumefaciens]MBP2576934.1 sn-glycerol 3-phosphate transport system substrate-binding protein [Agrobacterium tumefaciens]MBP2594885.1 sn-glycerol 3-phosphate transport system substrate-binding protein [Agrobacterium tumefaciens]